MKQLSVFLLLLFAASISFGQDCNSAVIDEAHVIKSRETMLASSGVRDLIDQGADVKFVTVSRPFTSLLEVEKYYEAACPSWLSPTHQRKANLAVFIVAPLRRKKNIFFGSAYSPEFPNEDSVNTLYSKASNSFFGAGQWEDGFTAVARDFSATVSAYHDQQQHPVTNTTTTTVNEAPTDLSGLWFFFKIVGGLFGLVLLFIAYVWYSKKKAAKDAAQTDALEEFRQAHQAFLTMDKTQANYDNVAATLSNMSNSLNYDPNEKLSVGQYEAIARAWQELRYEMRSPAVKAAEQSTAKAHHKYRTIKNKKDAYPQSPTPTQPGVTNTTVINQSSNSDGLLTGILIDEAIHADDRPRYSEPEPAPAQVRTGEDSNLGSSSSGSDSSWSSSDSDSSSSSFGGSDSSFGGDSGGGGGGFDSSF